MPCSPLLSQKALDYLNSLDGRCRCGGRLYIRGAVEAPERTRVSGGMPFGCVEVVCEVKLQGESSRSRNPLSLLRDQVHYDSEIGWYGLDKSGTEPMEVAG